MNKRRITKKFIKLSYLPTMIKDYTRSTGISFANLSRKVDVSNTFVCRVANRKCMCTKKLAYNLEKYTDKPFFQQYIREIDERNKYQWENLTMLSCDLEKDKKKILSKVEQDGYVVQNGDCNDLILSVPDKSIDVVFTDPPYPEIDRDYGKMSTQDWHYMMNRLIPEIKRVLKPSGSAVMVLQPNSEQIGSIRPWLWEFLARWSKDWNVVQDVYWWNYTAIPNCYSMPQAGLCRTSVKYCVWLGDKDCYRNQDNVLWKPAEETKLKSYRKRFRHGNNYSPSGTHVNEERIYNSFKKRGGVTPFNLLPVANTTSHDSAAAYGHGAGTPYDLTRWWLRYIGRKEGTVLDPFYGSGTTGMVTHDMGMKVIGFEKTKKYYKIAKQRTEEKYKQQTLSFEKDTDNV